MKDAKRDIFDRIMTLPGLRYFYEPYKKHKSVLLYLFFGGLTTVISIGSFILFDKALGITPLLANVFSWICAVAFAYVTNRIWVFSSHTTGAAALREAAAFVTGRIATLVFEELVLLIFVEMLHVNSILVKVLAQIGVLVFNYLISKIFVFSKN